MVQATKTPTRQVWGYIPDYDTAAAFASAEAHRDHLTGVSVVRCYLDRDGELREYPGLAPLPAALARDEGRVLALVTNQLEGRWTADAVAAAIVEGGRRRRHIETIVDYAGGGYNGVEIDYEGLPAGLRDPFSAFVEELSLALHRAGREVAVAVHAKLAEPSEGDGPAAQDWTRLGAAADRVAIMTYDFDPATPGAISPLTWTRAALDLAVSHIPSARVIQGIPLYGYHWAEGPTPSYLTYREFIGLAGQKGARPHRDPVDHHLVLEYSQGGQIHEAWISDAETVAALAAIGREVGVAGYSLWRLGGEDPAAIAALGVEPHSGGSALAGPITPP